MEYSPIACNRFGGSALMLAGILLAIGLPLHPDETASGFSFAAPWASIHIALGIAFLLAMYGFMVYMFRTETTMPTTGQVALTVLVGTNAIMSGLILFVEGFIFPVLGSDPATAQVLSESGPLMGGAFFSIFQLIIILYTIGAVVSGFYIARHSVLTSWAGWLLLATPLVAFVPPWPHMLAVVGGVIIGAGHVILGKKLWDADHRMKAG